MNNGSFQNFIAVNGFLLKKTLNESDQWFITSNGIIKIKYLPEYYLD
jgi:hypothetical protein